VTGTVTNGGTLFASGSGSLIQVASFAEVGDGLVAILGSSSENVKFLSTGNGGLAIARLRHGPGARVWRHGE
jgi:xanthine/uracil permease